MTQSLVSQFRRYSKAVCISLEFGVANHTRTYSNSHSGVVVMVVIVDIVGMVLLVGMLVELAAI